MSVWAYFWQSRSLYQVAAVVVGGWSGLPRNSGLN